jgi:hypothetical protein
VPSSCSSLNVKAIRFSLSLSVGAERQGERIAPSGPTAGRRQMRRRHGVTRLQTPAPHTPGSRSRPRAAHRQNQPSRRAVQHSLASVRGWEERKRPRRSARRPAQRCCFAPAVAGRHVGSWIETRGSKKTKKSSAVPTKALATSWRHDWRPVTRCLSFVSVRMRSAWVGST